MGKVRADELEELARLYGVETQYTDVSGRRRDASRESLVGVLRALGAPVAKLDDAADALREHRHSRMMRRVEPVNLAWDGEAVAITVRLPEAEASATVECALTLEGGEQHRWPVSFDQKALAEVGESEGVRILGGRLLLPDRLPSGYHRLQVRFPDEEVESLVIAAPTIAYSEAGGPRTPVGTVLPAPRTPPSIELGAGDFSDLEALMDWAGERGANLVATLPMLASTFDDSPTVSPYSPTSRLFWNEFYLDLGRIPELAHCAEARALMDSPEFRREVEALRAEPLVDYGRQMRLKRRVLEVLADWFFEHEAPRSSAFAEFLRENSDVLSYARFMAAGERSGGRPVEPAVSLQDVGVDEGARRYHLYAQWHADRQLQALSRGAQARQLTWYVDFPVGVAASSYDVWRYPDIFALGASVGCPPDAVFTKGQDWGFPPLHPERQREHQYRYMIASLQNHFRHANALRIDHVMGLHRLYWIPEGGDARDGAFVSYPAEELYAILSVESHRRGAWLVGENLGTVPPEVDRSLDRHRVHGMYVVQYEVQPDPDLPLREVPESVVASVNTHDMPPFAAFWHGKDIADRLDLGLFDASMVHQEEATRSAQRLSLETFLREAGLLDAGEEDPEAVLRACWEYLAGSSAHVVLLNLEDLWLETESQNTPNTWDERPNWRRKTRYSLDEFRRMPAVLESLRRVADRRQGAGWVDAPRDRARGRRIVNADR